MEMEKLLFSKLMAGEVMEHVSCQGSVMILDNCEKETVFTYTYMETLERDHEFLTHWNAAVCAINFMLAFFVTLAVIKGFFLFLLLQCCPYL